MRDIYISENQIQQSAIAFVAVVLAYQYISPTWVVGVGVGIAIPVTMGVAFVCHILYSVTKNYDISSIKAFNEFISRVYRQIMICQGGDPNHACGNLKTGRRWGVPIDTTRQTKSIPVNFEQIITDLGGDALTKEPTGADKSSLQELAEISQEVTIKEKVFPTVTSQNVTRLEKPREVITKQKVNQIEKPSEVIVKQKVNQIETPHEVLVKEEVVPFEIRSETPAAIPSFPIMIPADKIAQVMAMMENND